MSVIGTLHVALIRFWPEAAAVLDTFPGVADVRSVRGSRFSCAALRPVRRVTASSLAAMAGTVRRGAHAFLSLIGEAACRAVLAWLRAVAATGTGPVIDVLDLLVRHDTAH